MSSQGKIRYQSGSAGLSTSTKQQRGVPQEPPLDRLIGQLSWDVGAINVHLENIRRIWAEVLGVSGPQWLILMAVNALDQGAGVSVGDVATKLHVRSTFVTMETKLLEKSGFLTRTTSPVDGRIVLMALTDKTRKGLAHLSARRRKMDETIFADLDEENLVEVIETLSLIQRRMEKAALQLELDKSKPDV